MALHPGSYGQFGGESEGSLDKDILDAQNEVSRLKNMGISGLALRNAEKRLKDAQAAQQAATGSQQGLSQYIAEQATGGFTGGYTPSVVGESLRASTASLGQTPVAGFNPIPGGPAARINIPIAGQEPVAGFTPVSGGVFPRFSEDQVVARGAEALDLAPSSSVNFEGEGRLNADVRRAQNVVSSLGGRGDSLSSRYAQFRLGEAQSSLQAATGSQRGIDVTKRRRATSRRRSPRPRVGGRSRRSSFRSRPRSTRRFAGRFGIR